MKKLGLVLVIAIFLGGAIAYAGWASQPPEESDLEAVAGQVVDAQRITRTRWGRRQLIPREVYVGHDLSVRREDGEVVTFRIPDGAGIPEAKIEAMLNANIRGRFDPRENTLYELAAGRNVLSTYYASSEAQREDSRWNLLVGGALMLVGVILLGLLVSNQSKADALRS